VDRDTNPAATLSAESLANSGMMLPFVESAAIMDIAREEKTSEVAPFIQETEETETNNRLVRATKSVKSIGETACRDIGDKRTWAERAKTAGIAACSALYIAFDITHMEGVTTNYVKTGILNGPNIMLDTGLATLAGGAMHWIYYYGYAKAIQLGLKKMPKTTEECSRLISNDPESITGMAQASLKTPQEGESSKQSFKDRVKSRTKHTAALSVPGAFQSNMVYSVSQLSPEEQSKFTRETVTGSTLSALGKIALFNTVFAVTTLANHEVGSAILRFSHSLEGDVFITAGWTAGTVATLKSWKHVRGFINYLKKSALDTEIQAIPMVSSTTKAV
jgi:hypothetical protein